MAGEIEVGYCEGDACNRGSCAGIIDMRPTENCSCHISPPCGACTAPRNFCRGCGWEEADEVLINDYTVTVDHETKTHKSFRLRTLDATKIDWYSFSHTSSSMIKQGVYPEGAKIGDIRKMVNGTFGGRFESFGNGKFKFVAYTD